MYTLTACQDLIDRYVNQFGGECTELEEGVLGLGTMILHNAEGKKTIVIKEVYLNPWSSGHTIRMYNKMPKKFEKMLDKVW
jgi:hypothetical protein